MSDDLFEYKGFSLPVHLVHKTGAGPESFDELARFHIQKLERYIGIRPNDNVLEIGCGIGRDAIPLTEILNENGSYVGTDVIEESIQWCSENITAKHPNFKFFHHNISDTLHNATGTLSASDIVLPAENDSIDLIILQSVFTHMFEHEITHYLKEFRRVLKPTGRVWASVFIIDEQIRTRIADDPQTVYALRFLHPYGDGCYVNTLDETRGAVAFTREAVERMLQVSGMENVVPPVHGTWSGIWHDPDFGQDALVLQPLAIRKA